MELKNHMQTNVSAQQVFSVHTVPQFIFMNLHKYN